MKDLKEKAIRGGLAKVLSQGANAAFRLGALMVLARLLDPKDFGLVGMVTAIVGALYVFRDFGLSTAAVQRTSMTQDQSATLFWINVFIGTLLVAVCLAAAPSIARFYREPRLIEITVAVGASFLFNAAGVQHSAILQRDMRFTALAVIETISIVGSSVVAIAMALLGSGYWALVATTTLAPLLSTMCVWFATGWLPGRPRRGVGMRSIVRFGGTVTLNGLIMYVAYNVEKVLMGRFWGAETVGIYGRAYQLITMPGDNLNSAVSGVAFSALSRLQDQPARLKAYFLKGYALVLALSVPATIGCALFANDLVSVVLGPKWTEAAPIFQLLAPMVLVLACINPMYWLLVALGLIDRSLKIALVIAPLVIVAYLVGFQFGPKGVAFCYSAAMVLWLLPNIAWCVRGTPIAFSDILMTAAKPMISGCAAIPVVIGAQTFYGGLLSPLPRLLVGGILMLSVYLLVLLFVMRQKQLYVDIIRTMRRQTASGNLVEA